MPKTYMLHAMGIRKGLRMKKRGLEQLLASVMPVRHLKITGQGAQRRLPDSERVGSGSMVIKKGLTPVFRMNGTSDLSFEKYEVLRNGQTYSNIFTAFPEVQFYDYTKILGRKVKNISNYHLTFSAADGNDADVYRAIAEGYNVATVFGLKKTEPMPETYLGRTVFNGDDSDLRFLDPKSVVVGLYAKGKAKKDTSGFVKYPTIMLKAA